MYLYLCGPTVCLGSPSWELGCKLDSQGLITFNLRVEYYFRYTYYSESTKCQMVDGSQFHLTGRVVQNDKAWLWHHSNLAFGRY